MYAVIEAGGHQYRVKQGDTVTIDRVAGNEGDTLALDKVLMVGAGSDVKCGSPYLSGAKVEAAIKRQYKDDKVLVFKYKRRKNYKRLRGHRQAMTDIEIKKIKA